MQINISKWGNSLGLRIPKDIAASLGLHEGSRVEITADQTHMTVTPETPPQPVRQKAPFTIEELMADMTPEALRASMSKEDWDFWQTDVGSEIIED